MVVSIGNFLYDLLNSNVSAKFGKFGGKEPFYALQNHKPLQECLEYRKKNKKKKQKEHKERKKTSQLSVRRPDIRSLQS